ncbi:MAG: flavodoxin family protein [Syntrophorhabdaceae bacterium]|nr:flavodoxin family protein [Syntrophorhabdaceae bacterium]
MEKKKIIGLSCGRLNGNSEILLKEALMAAEEEGIETEMIRAMELKVKPCTGCETCTMLMAKGKESVCAIKDDDVPWILKKILLENAGFIVALPVYHLRANSYFEAIHERMLPIMFNNPHILKKNYPGAIICVGGGEPEWTPLGLTSANIFVQHAWRLVDHIQINFSGRPGSVLLYPEYIERARRLGKNMAHAMSIPIEEVVYVGDDSPVSCPVCHCDVFKIPGRLEEIFCPVCWIKGEIRPERDGLKVVWEDEKTRIPRFSEGGVSNHLDLIKGLQKRFYENQDRVKENMKRYEGYKKFVRPES